jgi:4-amino-4-deoxy-L-arabinose transferase-like glycosyltransferase
VPVRNRWPALVLAASALLLVAGLGHVPLLDPDESRFARTSVEMLRSGDWVVPTFAGQPRLAKPPLLHWLQACLFAWLGPVEWAARVHAVLATLATIALVGWIAARRISPGAGAWASACLATMPLVFVLGRVGTLDSLLSLAILGVVALDLTAGREIGAARALGMGALLGLACLVKGPVGLLLPLLLMGVGRVASRQEARLRVRALVLAVCAWCLVALPWLLALVQRGALVDGVAVLLQEALDPYVAGTIHREPLGYFVPVAVLGFLPWSGTLALAIFHTVTGRDAAQSALARYAGAALLAGLLFFTLGRAKLSSYLLPLAPMAALLASWELDRKRRIGAAVLAVTLAIFALALALYTPSARAMELRPWTAAAAALYAAAAAVASWAAIVGRPGRARAAALVASAGFLLLLALVVHPMLGRSRSAAPLVRAVPALRMSRAIVTVDMHLPSLNFYLDRSLELVPLPLLRWRLAWNDEPLLVFDAADLAEVPPAERAGLRELGGHGKYVVLAKRRPAS